MCVTDWQQMWRAVLRSCSFRLSCLHPNTLFNRPWVCDKKSENNNFWWDQEEVIGDYVLVFCFAFLVNCSVWSPACIDSTLYWCLACLA